MSEFNSDFSTNSNSDSESAFYSNSIFIKLVVFVSFALYLHSSKQTCG